MGTKADSRAKELMEMEDQLYGEMREEYRQRLQRRLQERLKAKERGLPEAQRLKKTRRPAAPEKRLWDHRPPSAQGVLPRAEKMDRSGAGGVGAVE